MTKGELSIIAIVEPVQIEAARSMLLQAGAPSTIKVASCIDYSIDEGINISTYNRALKTKDFWNSLDANQVLIFQSDSLLIKPLPGLFFQYSFLGAPWYDNVCIAERFPIYNQLEEGMFGEFCYQKPLWNRSASNWMPYSRFYGNGGLSIRNTSEMIRICEQFGNQSPPEEHEDIFFARHLRDSIEQPPREIAQLFSAETMFSANVHGFHASYKYITSWQQAKYYDEHIKNLNAICELLH